MIDEKIYTKEEISRRIDYLIDCGFDKETATKIAMFSHNGISFAIPSK